MGKWEITFGTNDGKELKVTAKDDDEAYDLEQVPFKGGRINRATAVPVDEDDE